MHRHVWIVALVGGVFFLAHPAQAGIYLATQAAYFPETARDVKLYLGELRGIPVAAPDGSPPDPGSLRFEYLQHTEKLEAKARDGNLSNLDRIDLGACYIRLRQFNKAVEVLRAGDQTHFLILANLATAFFEMGELDLALRYQEQALAAWPPVWAGWTSARWSWFHRCEKHLLTLMRHRQEEQRQSGGRAVAARTIDPLFPRLRLPLGAKYEAGPLPLLREELPGDAMQIVLQLMIWLPYDGRIAWLYAELLNINGDIDGAYRQMDELVFTRDWSNVEELRRHKQTLMQARNDREALNLELRTSLLWAMAPRGLVGSPGAGSIAAETAWPASDYLSRRKPESPSPSQANDNPEQLALYPWKAFVVGLGLGAIAGWLIVLQWREWSRRRARNQQRAVAMAETEKPPG